VEGPGDASLAKEFGGLFSAETTHDDDRQARRLRRRPAGRGEEAGGPVTGGGVDAGRRSRWGYQPAYTETYSKERGAWVNRCQNQSKCPILPADCPCQSTGVAEHHAALAFAAWDNSFVLQDFNSPHGTFVNGCQVQNAAVKVSPGDILRFGVGGASFELVVDGAAPVKVSAAAQGRVGAAAQGWPWSWSRLPGSSG